MINPRINWEELLHGDYTDVDFMLRDMYDKLRSTTRMSEVLGVSRGTILRTLRARGVTINRRGGDVRQPNVKKKA